MIHESSEDGVLASRKVLFVYDGDWPRGATRVRKLTRALCKGGFSVRLVCRNDTRSPRFDREDWMTVSRLPSLPLRSLNRVLNFPFFFSPVWLWQIIHEVRVWRPRLIVVEDLPLSLTAIFVGRLFSIPVVYDMAEVYPEFLRGLQQFKKASFTDKLLRNPGPASAIERIVLSKADWTLVVSAESMARAIELGVDQGRISVVGNTPEDTAQLRAEAPVPLELVHMEGRPVILFVGILIADRGLLEAVRAMDRVRASCPDAILVIVGEGPERTRIEAEVRRLHLEEHVLLTGWKDPECLPGYYQAARVGILPFLDGGQIRLTLANKLFDYMASGLPLVASDVPPMRRVLSEYGAGVLVGPGDSDALATGILEVLNAEDVAWLDMSAAGLAAASQAYRWELDRERFLEAISSV